MYMNDSNFSDSYDFFDDWTDSYEGIIPDDFHFDQELSDSDYEKDDVLEAAQKAFGIKYLYPWQRIVMANILEDSEEPVRQIVLLPTGAGKSLCFMVPALCLEGPTLILYPLLALMNDQARRLVEGGMRPVVFKGGQSAEERKANFEALEQGAKVILANPEVLQNDALVARLAECGIAQIAIDEAHCVSEWGDSFRPAYLTLGNIIKKLDVPRVTAFTATASPEVLARINQVLFDGEARILRSEADRPNIHYFVHYAVCKEKAVLQLVEREEKPLLVFCGTRKRAENMARLIREHQKQLHPEKDDIVRFYHAGLEREEKTVIEQWFYPKSDAIMTSTCAFGMGTDKKDIHTVIHLDVPSTAEAFIQEAGRGGRDGSVAKSFLVWGPEDTESYKSRLAQNQTGRSTAMGRFALSSTCRRQVLLDELGAEQAACDGCDICLKTAQKTAPDKEFVFKAIKRAPRIYTASELASYLADSVRSSTVGNNGEPLQFESYEAEDYGEIIRILFKEGRIKTGKYFWKKKLWATGNSSVYISSDSVSALSGSGAS